MSKKVPILFLSDSISCTSGLGRITRDLAVRTHQYCSDVFEVATVGYGGPGSRKFPFPEYHLHSVDNWTPPELPTVWNDFVGDREGILFTIWDLSRLYWLGNPALCPIPHLRRWVESAKMKKWAYHAIDAEGPQGHLSTKVADTMKGFDRVLDYSAFSSKITGNPDHLPHGIDSTVFYPRDKQQSKKAFREGGFQGLTDDSLLVGIVATNQARKNWQLGIETCRILLDRGVDVRLWCHTDVLERHWSLPNLVVDYGLVGRAAVTTTRFTDEQMAHMYSACDVTLGIGNGEGYGYPLFESIACGTPCIHGTYSGASENMPKEYLVEPIAYYHENPFCSKRAVYNASDWADACLRQNSPAQLPDNVNWSKGILWKGWDKWLRAGL